VGYQEIGDLDRWLAYLTELSFLCTYSNFWSTIVVLFRPVVIVRSIELEYRRSIVIFAAADQNVSKNNTSSGCFCGAIKVFQQQKMTLLSKHE
jgi:hypothetical protein